MKDLLAIFKALSAAPKAALATLVKVEGSSYRRAGARLLWVPDVQRIGTISGGCLEEDLLAHCDRVLDTGRSATITYDTTMENDEVWGVGLGCNGIAHLLVERVSGLSAPLQFVADAWHRREAVVLATIFRAARDQRLGSVFALSERGFQSEYGLSAMDRDSIVAGSTEAMQSRASLSRGFPQLPDSPEIFFEYLPPPLSLLIFGAGDDAQPLTRFAKELGWSVSVLDPRSAYATARRFPEADAVIVAPTNDSTSRVSLDARTIAVVMTHHYVHDRPLLSALLKHELPYIGLLGPKKRAERILSELTEEGVKFTPELRGRLHAPVGLDLGSNTPEEVAVSIIAEIQSVVGKRDGRPLRDRARPIHE
jgi:xanthine/CO dehydrogenase XdhC/CoxF family maturation factor